MEQGEVGSRGNWTRRARDVGGSSGESGGRVHLPAAGAVVGGDLQWVAVSAHLPKFCVMNVFRR